METLPKAMRLRGRERIGQLFAEGNGGASRRVLVKALPNTDGQTRVAAVAGKKLGCAVKRNRMRRRLRAAFRTNRDRLPQGCDFALVARKGLLEASWPEVVRDVEKAMRAAADTPSGRPRSGPRP
jgi:ribonuclease P protein component